MANIATANGTLQIINGEKLSKETLKKVIEMINKQLGSSSVAYGTFLSDLQVVDDKSLNTFIANDYMTSFEGLGKWSFITNTTYMFEWITTDVNKKTHQPLENHNYDSLLKEIQEKDISFLFDYSELELGAKPNDLTFIQSEVRPYFDKNINQFVTDVLDNDSHDEDLTATLLVENGFIENYITLSDLEKYANSKLEDDSFIKEHLTQEDAKNILKDDREQFKNGKYVLIPDIELYIEE